MSPSDWDFNYLGGTQTDGADWNFQYGGATPTGAGGVDLFGSIGDVASDIFGSIGGAIEGFMGSGIGNLLLSGAMAAMDQKDRPISLLLLNDGMPAGLHWVQPRPEDMTYTHPTRATPINTLGGAYIDDFGSAIVDIQLRANTGYKMGLLGGDNGGGLLGSGDVMLFNLRSWIVDSYHQMRLSKSEAGEDPETVEMILLDTLNLATWVIYPQSFVVQRNKQRPLLYQYILKAWGLKRLV